MYPDVRLRANGRIEVGGVRSPLTALRYIVRRDPCAYCGRKSQSIDHVVPKSAGGNEGSLAGACFACNWQKRDMPLLQFLAARMDGRLRRVPDYVARHDLEGTRAQRKARRRELAAMARQPAPPAPRRADGQPFNPLREKLIRAGVVAPARGGRKP